MENQTIVPAHRNLSPLQLFGIILVANTAVRALANRPAAPQIVRNVVETVCETKTSTD